MGNLSRPAAFPEGNLQIMIPTGTLLETDGVEGRSVVERGEEKGWTRTDK